MFIAIHRNHFQCSVGAQSVFPTKGISRSTGAKRFLSALWFYKHLVPPGLQRARLFVMRTLETADYSREASGLSSGLPAFVLSTPTAVRPPSSPLPSMSAA